jgi:hypothetical protein
LSKDQKRLRQQQPNVRNLSTIDQQQTMGGSAFGEAKPMVGTIVHSPIGLLRKRAATLAAPPPKPPLP